MKPALAIVPTPALRLAEPIVEDYAYLCKRMRPDEIEQHRALRGGAPFDADRAARELCEVRGPTYSLIDASGRPVAASGFDYLRPGVYECWAIGTVEGWERHWRAFTLTANRIMRGMLAGDVHRIQTVALASRTKAMEWYERGLDMQREGVLRGYFSDGQDGVLFARVRK